MSTPPRRRRAGPQNPKPDGVGWLLTIAMVLGIIVAGLGIGALVAVLMQRGGGGSSPATAPVALVTSTPQPARTREPIAIETFEPPRTPRPSPASSATATATPTPAPTRTPGTSASPRASDVPRVTATDDAKVVERRVAQAVPAVPVTPRASPPAEVPATVTTPTAGVFVGPSPVAPTSAPSTSSYDEHASAVVRRYVDALIRGDEKTAYSTLGGSGTLSEQAFLDPSAHIVSLKVTRIDASNASVGCEIATAKGHYYGTYHVTAATSGPYIAQHDYIKV